MRYKYLLGFILLVGVFFTAVPFKGKVPIPTDTIVGLYHPYRDFFAKDYSSGIPFKNFLITDPVRQQYPWRELAISLQKSLQMPLWNPYVATGAPLLANLQSAAWYPLNVFLYVLPFPIGWSLLIILQPLLAGVFCYFYLRNFRIEKSASFLGAFSYAFCGFSIAWMEWGTVIHVALWFPLILLAMDRMLNDFLIPSKNKTAVIHKGYLLWATVFICALSSSFLAGHLQVFFYLFVFTVCYAAVRFFQQKKNFQVLLLLLGVFAAFFLITFPQWWATMQLILLSARDVDQSFGQPGWFLPWQNLTQFLAPDFFGNPTTLNYWGIWNYAEFVGYIGVIPFLFALYCLFNRRDKKTMFFAALVLVALLFALQNPLSELPFRFHLPFIATAQPSRLLFIVDFGLSILAAFGFDLFLKKKQKMEWIVLLVFLLFGSTWCFVFFGSKIFPGVSLQDIQVTKQNLIFPTALFFLSSFFVLLMQFGKEKRMGQIVLILLLGVSVVDLFRFGWKFLPFSEKSYLFPETKAIRFLQANQGRYRFMTTDDRILPPNFSVVYRLQTIDSYDPLYLLRYGELIAAIERKNPDIHAPFGFNRIITPHAYTSPLINLLGVKYILSFDNLTFSSFTKVFQEGQTKIYENKNVLPRVFFVDSIKTAENKKDAMKLLFANNLSKTAIVELEGNEIFSPGKLTAGKIVIDLYEENKVMIRTKSSGDGFLVITDSYYPTWHARINGRRVPIYRTDYNFRGIVVPKGENIITFSNNLL